MNTTSASLLERLREPSPAKAWDRFVELYLPLVHSWARRLGLVQDVTVGAAYAAKFRVLARLREELAGLFED